jgi:hypothetical protein
MYTRHTKASAPTGHTHSLDSVSLQLPAYVCALDRIKTTLPLTFLVVFWGIGHENNCLIRYIHEEELQLMSLCYHLSVVSRKHPFLKLPSR